MANKYDLLINSIYQVLPADSVEDIAKKVKAPFIDVKQAIRHLRKHSSLYGWTIPYVVSQTVDDDPSHKGKYFAVILQKNSASVIDADKRLHYTRGAHDSLKRIATLLQHEAQALLSCALNERSQNKKYMIESVVQDMEFVRSKAAAASKLFGT